jgi:trans-2,3-dihydro-3-hydroxyanthranilate isomerase
MADRRYPFVQVDVFTRRAFGGNQLAVFTDARGLADVEMQAIAREMNYSESTFVLPPDDRSNDARVRIFTPGRELPFAGHPTVGTAYVLGTARGLGALRLELGVGPIGVSVELGDGRAGAAEMEQPLPTFRPVNSDAATLAGLLGLAPEDVAASPPPEFGSAGVEFLYLPLRSLEAVQRASADLAALRRFFADHGHPAIYVFSTETVSPDAAAHARMFALSLGSGVNEDPATGSAAGPVGASLVRHGLQQPGRFTLEQGYEIQCPSQIEVEIAVTAGAVRRVRVGGGVVRVAEGVLLA